MHRSNAVIVPMHAGFNDDVVVPAGYEHDRPSWQPHHAYCIVSFLKRIIADWQTSVVCQLLLACHEGVSNTDRDRVQVDCRCSHPFVAPLTNRGRSTGWQYGISLSAAIPHV